ncbi:hypothetical protein Ahy_A03g013679 [Arachis hypogaea]|uniref:Replication protein A 70 kDa DNA-binding subunit B/D first OB fold domain-containing protein n=1 Tax=Arachis hypogaea TaxID=3818 RepID=A0A445DVX8_ARAHY|nr:hypothetical protein Ahy_A03g013679 [Arachis hypogaea]
MPPPFDMISKMHPPREAWRLKVRVLSLWFIPSFVNHEKPLLNRFRDHKVEGQVYRMIYFTVVSNHGSYRATSHEFKLVFLHRTTVVAVDEDDGHPEGNWKTFTWGDRQSFKITMRLSSFELVVFMFILYTNELKKKIKEQFPDLFFHSYC